MYKLNTKAVLPSLFAILKPPQQPPHYNWNDTAWQMKWDGAPIGMRARSNWCQLTNQAELCNKYITLVVKTMGMQSIHCMFWVIYAVYRLHVCKKNAVYIIPHIQHQLLYRLYLRTWDYKEPLLLRRWILRWCRCISFCWMRRSIRITGWSRWILWVNKLQSVIYIHLLKPK